LFSSIFSGLGLLWDRQFGFLKETLVAPVPRIQIMIGRTLGGCTVAVIQGLLVTTISVIAGFRPSNYLAIPMALGFMLLIALRSRRSAWPSARPCRTCRASSSS
jgi:ABC-2 type transport system permease protein